MVFDTLDDAVTCRYGRFFLRNECCMFRLAVELVGLSNNTVLFHK
jgi:hypothetical protein